MDNLSRLKLELSHKSYFSDEEYCIFLSENGLIATDTYDKQKDELYLLQTLVAILQALSNNIDLYMRITTEFTSQSSAFSNIRTRIDELNKRIALIPTYESTANTITYLFHN